MLPVTSIMETSVESHVMQDLVDGFSKLYCYDQKQLSYVACFELENLKEICVWLSGLFTDDYHKAKRVSEVALCMVTLRAHFEFGEPINVEPYKGHVNFTDAHGDCLRQKIASSLLPHRGLGPTRKAELDQSMGYLGTVKVFFEDLRNKAFLEVIWPIHELLDEVRGHL